jgi:streptomycin 6-kinase
MEELTTPDEPQLLLHGDLHHWNILLDEGRGWMAIDPKGVVGASCLEVGCFLGNALNQGNTAAEKHQILMNAIRKLSDRLCQHRERIFAGAFCDFVMANSWDLKEEPNSRSPASVEVGLQALLQVGEEVSV